MSRCNTCGKPGNFYCSKQCAEALVIEPRVKKVTESSVDILPVPFSRKEFNKQNGH